jgi:cation/acetate symporter
VIFSLIIMYLVSRFGRARDTCADFYTAGRAFTAPQNGLALFGTFMMMTSFVATSDEIALHGSRGVLSAAGLAVSWLVALFLVAEPLRNTSKYTLGDTLSVRMRERPVRLATAIVTLLVFFSFMSLQLVGASRLLAQLLHLPGTAGHGAIIAVIGAFTAITVHRGGMRGTTWTQIINAFLLFAAVFVLAGALLVRYRFNASTLLGDAEVHAGPTPGGPEFYSQLLTTVLGYAALPYLFIRYLSVPTAAHVRRSVSWAIWLITPFYLLVILIGLGTTALIGDSSRRQSAVPLLAAELGGYPLLVLIASVVFTTIIAVSAGLAISAAASFTRDIYANLIHTNVARRGPLSEADEITIARRAVVVLCVLQTACAILLLDQDIGFLLSLDVTLVASSILPALLYSWFWRGFNTSGALWSIYGGAAATIVLVVLSPAVLGWFPWRSVGLVSIPLGFLMGCAGAGRSPERDDPKFAEMEVRALTGAGAAGPAIER